MSSPKPNEFIILVFGPTGAGKSTFINDASCSKQMRVGGEQESCTKEVASTEPFLIDDNYVTLIDTPGLNNDDSTGVQEIFKEVKTLLKNKHNGKQPQGIIYIHAIDARQVEKSIQSDIKKICSVPLNEPKSSFIVAMTRWETTDPKHTLKWEEKLKKDDVLFKQFADLGVSFVRHYGSGLKTESAQKIVRCLLKSTEAIDLKPALEDNRSKSQPKHGRARKGNFLRRLFGFR